MCIQCTFEILKVCFVLFFPFSSTFATESPIVSTYIDQTAHFLVESELPALDLASYFGPQGLSVTTEIIA